MYGESSTTDEHNENLSTNNDELNADEPVIFDHAFENVEAIIETSSVPLIEDLHPHEGVENCTLKTVFLGRSLIAENAGSCKVENKSNGQLVYRLPNNHLPHG